MYDRQFLPPAFASASASVEGMAAPRTASRLVSEPHAGGVAEPLAKRQTETGSDRTAHSMSPSEGDRPQVTSAPPTEVTDMAPDAAAEAEADAILEADRAAQTAQAAQAADSAEAVETTRQGEDAPDLSGYNAYGKVPQPGPSMSRDQLVARYSHLVKYVVGRLGVSVPGLFDHEDAMQAGVLGLLRAIDAYKPEAAASFESYAILRIRGSILDAVRSLDTVGRAGREAARAIQGAIRDLQHELGRSPSETEIAARLGMPVTRYRER